MNKRRYAVSGIGHRAHSWLKAATKHHAATGDVIALCDPVKERCEDAVVEYGLNVARTYTDFPTMLDEAKPDAVIIVAPERFHAEQIVAALDRGCDVATEKPLCLTMEESRRILDAERRNNRKVFMGFNYRHIPLLSKVREILLAGTIGRPVSIDLTWYLDYRGHGASYFRRWHRRMVESGGLLITKASHHFDLANWFMNDRPASVYAKGRQNFFGPGRHPYQGERCSTCKHGPECDWFTPVNIRSPNYEQLSQELGYTVKGVRDYARDYCPFGNDVDIPDTMSVLVEYERGGLLSYSLNASVPFEGWNLAINGTGGRLETKITDAKPSPEGEAGYKILSKDGRRQGSDTYRIVEWPDRYQILVMPHEGKAHRIEVPNVMEGHGGGDGVLFERFFRGTQTEDPLQSFASALDGVWSVAVGAAANESIACGSSVSIPDFRA